MERKRNKARSTGPVTDIGKARSSMNSLRHGALSSKVLLPGERVEEFEAVLQGMIADLRPVGTLETILVQKIAEVIWRKTRLDIAEQEATTAARLRDVDKNDLARHLNLYPKQDPNEILSFSEEPLDFPEWMLNEKNAPDEEVGQRAVLIQHESQYIHAGKVKVETHEDAKRNCPECWSELLKESNRAGFSDPDAYLMKFKNAKLKHFFAEYCKEASKKVYWTAYWHENRTKIEFAFQAIRRNYVAAAWDAEKAHRYHAMLNNELFKLLKELRATQEWRLKTIEASDIEIADDKTD
ncbi:hypothetical protein SAMN06265795_11492 [Noviherbaspirillum humi]|uniref:Uncharacterized protein n=1 Tax=Noviherbaspirillum humi TaxID=1688639 RepID=A0A239K1Q0_9BURK|nr:hypothetical protein [Noviherbaspirillum humi]SNT11950.1 hypothetical protein SAMN06265795_11492 [Noviherbaspirillum humi]